MIVEDTWRIRLSCDRSGCPEMATVTGPTRDACNQQLYDLGWRLYRKKILCRTHGREVSRRLAKHQ
jgi:hypothetical protein